jgi:TP901 family phage tail tape measure protein
MAVTSAYTAAMQQAGQSTTKFAKDATAATGRTARSLQQVQTEATLVGGALLGIGIAAVAASTTFDKQMSAVQAASKASAQQLDALRESALQAGADTAFSATEAAQGQEELAKAGLSTADILGGALKGSLDLAAAGAVSVADASEIAATALKVFGLRGNEVGHVADLLAAGAGKAQGGVNDLGMALKQSALVADQTGLSIEDTVGALSQFASAGLLGSDAGTSFKAMLQRLTPQSKEAADLMDSLGLRAYDASGQFIGLEAYAGKLRTQLGKLAPEQRNAALQTLFGADAVRAAAILYNDGAEGVAKWRDNVDDSGFAAEQAALRLDNLAGDLEKLSGTIETNFIKGGSSVNGVLRFMAQAADTAAQRVGDLPGPVLGVGVAAATAAGGFLLLAPRVVDSVDAFKRMSEASPRTGRAIGTVGKAAGKAAVALVAMQAAATAINAIGDASVNSGKGVNELQNELIALAAGGEATGLGFNTLTGDYKDFNDALTRSETRNALDSFSGFLDGIVGTKGALTQAEESIDGVDRALAGLVGSGRLDEARSAFDRLRASYVAAGGDGAVFDEQMNDYRDALAGVDVAATGAAGSTGDLAGATTNADEAAQNAEDAYKRLDAALQALRGETIGADEATANLEQSIDDARKATKGLEGATKKNRTELDLNTASGRKAQGALQGITDDLFAAVPAWQKAGASTTEVERRTQKARDAFVDAATKAGLTKTAAEKLATAYGLVPKKVATAVSTSGVSQAQAAVDVLTGKINSIPTSIRIQVTADGDLIGRGTGGGAPPPPKKKKRADGGYISGPGTTRSDSIPTWLSTGEFVATAEATRRNRPALEAMNAGHVYRGGANTVGSGSTLTQVVTVTAAPGERAEETVPRALRRQAFLNGMGG